MGRASNRKKATAAARPQAVKSQPSEPQLRALMPRSVQALGPSQVEAVQRMQRLEIERRDVERQLDDLVIKSRRAGISWAALGWAIGVSAQAVQQRYANRL